MSERKQVLIWVSEQYLWLLDQIDERERHAFWKEIEEIIDAKLIKMNAERNKDLLRTGD